MAEKLHHPELMKIRNRYHMARRHKLWPTVKSLVASDDPVKQKRARRIAHAIVNATPGMRALQAGSRVSLEKKKDFLRVQAAAEKSIRAELAAGSDAICGAVRRAAGPDGTIKPGRRHALLTIVKKANRAAYKGVNREFLKLVKAGARGGLKGAMAVGAAIKLSLQHDLEKANEQEQSCPTPGNKLSHPWERQRSAPGNILKKENTVEIENTSSERWISFTEDDSEDSQDDSPDPLRQKVEYAVRSGVFDKIFTGAMKTTMEAGLFGETGVSSRVWDLSDQNLLILKRIISNGIANGDDVGSIAGSIQDLLIQPAGFDYSYGGPGVYRSAWKNAMRLARNESNRAFGAANALFAEEKDWNVVWHVSEGQREEDECDDLDGIEMTPDEFIDQFPQHPNCMCYSTFAIPDMVDNSSDVPESDDEPAPEDDPGAGE
jgi:hypothetical protein